MLCLGAACLVLLGAVALRARRSLDAALAQDDVLFTSLLAERDRTRLAVDLMLHSLRRGQAAAWWTVPRVPRGAGSMRPPPAGERPMSCWDE